MEIISRKEAQNFGLKRYFTNKACKHGHVSERLTVNGSCCECARLRELGNKARKNEYYRANRERILNSRKEYQASNKEKISEYLRSYQEENLDRLREYRRDWYKDNRSKRLDYAKSYYRSNKPRFVASAVKRKEAEAQRTPPWLTSEDYKNMRAVYEMSSRLSNCLGIPHHTDHIIPLRGKAVCGLHVPWNLRSIPASLNLAKNNKLLETDLE